MTAPQSAMTLGSVDLNEREIRYLINCRSWDVEGNGACYNIGFARQSSYSGVQLLDSEMPSNKASSSALPRRKIGDRSVT